jgi:hypothetical protein
LQYLVFYWRHRAEKAETVRERVAALKELAVALGHLGRHDEARKTLGVALELAPGDPQLTRLYMEQSRYVQPKTPDVPRPAP